MRLWFPFIATSYITTSDSWHGIDRHRMLHYLRKAAEFNGEINEHSLQTKGCGNESSQNKDGWLTVRINNIVFI